MTHFENDSTRSNKPTHNHTTPHHTAPGKLFIFLAMPQPFTAPQMLACQQRLARALAQTKPRCLVKLSSFGIDDKSSKFVMVGAAMRGFCKSTDGTVCVPFIRMEKPPIPTPQTQGPLGEAHREGEAALCAAGIPWLVSLRPSSFFANFDAYDLPGLVAGGRCIRSPLGGCASVVVLSTIGTNEPSDTKQPDQPNIQALRPA